MGREQPKDTAYDAEFWTAGQLEMGVTPTVFPGSNMMIIG